MHRSTSLSVVVIALAGTLLSAAGCDGARQNPQDQCETLAATLCRRGASCMNAVEQAQCTETTARDLQCSRTEGVSVRYDECIHDVEFAHCGNLFPQEGIDTPASCDGVLDIPLSPEEMKCFALAEAICVKVDACAGNDRLDDCAIDVADAIGCVGVKPLTAAADVCLAAVDATDCPALFARGRIMLPAVCEPPKPMARAARMTSARLGRAAFVRTFEARR